MCATPAEVNAAADALCRRARSAEERIGDYRIAAETAETREAICWGRLDQVLETPTPEPWRLPAGLRIAWDLAVASTSAAAGVLVVSDVPGEVRWSAVTLAGVLVVGRVVAELVD